MQNPTHFPWRDNCSFELLTDGQRFFPRILSEIDKATKCIDIELYLVWPDTATDKAIDGLIRAAARGVKVRCLFDAVGSADLDEGRRNRLLAGGVGLRFYNRLRLGAGQRNLYRDHRKILIFDEKFVCTGGFGFSDPFCTPSEDNNRVTPWHDQMLVIQGPVVQDWQVLFNSAWRTHDRPARKQLRNFIRPRHPGRPRIPAWPASRNGQGRVAYTESRHNNELVRALLASIRQAEHRIWLATPYFLPGWRIRRALQRAARRGVDVRLLLAGEQNDVPPVRYAGQRYFSRLLRAGIRIYEYEPRFIHLKTVLVDDWASIGSCNFDHWTLHWNLEANQNALDHQLADDVAASFELDFGDSHEWTLSGWRKVSAWHRLKIRVWGTINRVVMVWFGMR